MAAQEAPENTHGIDGRDDPLVREFQAGSYVTIFSYARERQTQRDVAEARPLNPQTVAVLALHNQSGDPEQEYFCDGITDDIIHALRRIPGLNVIGHASVFACKGVPEDARVIGNKVRPARWWTEPSASWVAG